MKTGYSEAPFPRYFFTFIDYLSGFCGIFPVFTALNAGPSSADIWQAVLLMTQLFGWPAEVVYDAGTNLVPLARYFAAHGVQPLILPPNCETRRGRIERSHRVLTDAIRCAANSSSVFRPTDVLTSLFGRIQALNTSPIDGITPSDLFFGFTPTESGMQTSSPSRLSYEQALERIGFDQPTIENLIDQVHFNKTRSQNLINSATQMLKGRRLDNRETVANRTRLTRNFGDIDVGSLVYVYRKPLSKFDVMWRGPFFVHSYNANTDEYFISDGSIQVASNLKRAATDCANQAVTLPARAKNSTLGTIPVKNQVVFFDGNFFRISNVSSSGLLELTKLVFDFETRNFSDTSITASSDNLSVEILSGVRYVSDSSYRISRPSFNRIVELLKQ